MKKSLLLLLAVVSINVAAQEHWEDEFWAKDVNKRCKETYTMAGMYTSFYKNGQIKWRGSCLDDGMPAGMWIYYTEDGQKAWEGEYNGKFYEFCKNPKSSKTFQDTLVIGNYKDGLRHGQWIEFDYDGNHIIRKGHYLNGEPTGIWENFKEERIVKTTVKSSEYNYATGTRHDFFKDSIIETFLVDSADFAEENEIWLQTNSYSSISFSLRGTARSFNPKPLNNYFFQTGYSMFEALSYSAEGEILVTQDQYQWGFHTGWSPAVSAQVNDSLRLRLSGYNLSFFMGFDLIKSKIVDFTPAIGIGFQQLKLKVSELKKNEYLSNTFNDVNYRIYKNPSPFLNAVLNARLNLNYLSLNFYGGYIQDCSSNRWRYNGRFLPDSPRTSVSGLFAGVSLGIRLALD